MLSKRRRSSLGVSTPSETVLPDERGAARATEVLRACAKGVDADLVPAELVRHHDQPLDLEAGVDKALEVLCRPLSETAIPTGRLIDPANAPAERRPHEQFVLVVEHLHVLERRVNHVHDAVAVDRELLGACKAADVIASLAKAQTNVPSLVNFWTRRSASCRRRRRCRPCRWRRPGGDGTGRPRRRRRR